MTAVIESLIEARAKPKCEQDEPQLVNARATFCQRFYADDLWPVYFRDRFGQSQRVTQDARVGQAGAYMARLIARYLNCSKIVSFNSHKNQKVISLAVLEICRQPRQTNRNLRVLCTTGEGEQTHFVKENTESNNMSKRKGLDPSSNPNADFSDFLMGK